MKKEQIHTDQAPQAIGAYSQAIRVDKTVYLSGQIPLHPATMTLVIGDFNEQVQRVFANLKAVAEASGGSLNNIVKLNVYLTDMAHFPLLNEIMAHCFEAPYPARAVVAVSALPKEALVEVDAVMVLDEEYTF